MANIIVNDIFEEIIEENFKLNECLNVLIKFKTFVDLICDKLKTNLESNVLQMFEDIHEEVQEVFRHNQKQFVVNKNLNQRRRTKLIEFLSSKPQPIDSNNKTSSQSIESTKIESKRVKSKKLPKKRSKLQMKSQTKGIKNNENQEFVCNFIGCGKQFKNRGYLRGHIRIHSTGPKRYQCDVDGCAFSTWYRLELNDHINAHKGIKPYPCSECEKMFSSQRLLRRHFKNVHEVSDKILICELDQCYKQFRTEMSFKNHQKFHLLEKRFVCDEPNCVFKTIKLHILRQHKYEVHSPEKPLKCPVGGCPKAYKHRYLLNRHLEHHTSERNFKCQFTGCEKAFKTEFDLKKHTILHSDIQMECDWPGCDYTTKLSQRLQQHYLIHSCERNFTCNWPECGKRFKDKLHLETHQRIHTSDKKFACNWPGCQYRCTDSGNLIKHRRIHDKN